MKWKFKKNIVGLLRLNNSPPEIAFGAAIGIFIAILPVYGLHTLLVILAAVFIPRANKIAILLGTNISLPPTVPFITWAGYEIGRRLLKGDFPPLGWSDFKNITFKRAAGLYPALFLGSMILGLICAVFFYFIIYLFVKSLKERKRSARRA